MNQNTIVQKNNFFTGSFSPLLAILFSLFLFCINVTQAQEIRFLNTTSEDGLSINGVTKLLQDKKGFIWLGTFNGLNRYDGYTFKIFLPEPGNSKSISHHSLSALVQDNNGYIWCGTKDGLNRFDWRTEKFAKFKNNPKDQSSLSENHIYCIHKSKEGTIWIGTLNGLNKYNPDKNNFTVFKKVHKIYNPDSLNTVTCIDEDKNGNLWMGTWDGLIQMNKEGKVLASFFDEGPKAKSINYRKISSIYVDKLNTIWVGTSDRGLKKYDAKNRSFISYRSIPGNPNTISNDNVTTIFEDRLGNLWVGTANGLNKFDKKKNSFTRYYNDPEKPLSLVNNEILSITEDKNGLMWIGTSGGVSCFYQTENRFHYITADKQNPEEGLPHNQVTSILLDSKKNLWVGTPEGVAKISFETNKTTRIIRHPGSNSIGSNNVMSVYEDSKGMIWIGTNDVSLNRLNPVTGEIKHYIYNSTDPASISNEGVTTICEDKKGNLWFGTWWGLNKYDRNTDNFYRYMANPQNSTSLKVDVIWKVFEDSKDFIWVGTDGGGVSRLDPQTNIFTNFVHDSTRANSISGNIGITVFETKDGMMWFGTNEGLNRYDRSSGKFKSYTKADGLPSQFVNSIEEDKEGYLWLSGDKGLSRFDRKTETFINYAKKEGIKELEFSARVSSNSKNGTLYFGTKKGMLIFNPQEIKETGSQAPVVFTDLKIFNQSVPISDDGSSVLDVSITGADVIKIPYKEDVITFEFALLDYFNSGEKSYTYKLEGFDEKWNSMGHRNSATYTNLPPGEYNFIVHAFIGNRITNQKKTSIRLVVVPAFYQTIFFKVALISLIALLGLYLIQVRTKKMNEINRALEARVAERTKDLDAMITELSQEIDERKKAEEKVKASLEEKEILLKEVHHRVKNNLQVVSSLLFLQSTHLKDQDAQKLFIDSQNRIKSMALIHEKLYQSENISKISFNEYVKSLLEHLNASYQEISQFVKTKINIEDLHLNLDMAISCGLIINELITNAYKYAFPFVWMSEREVGYDPTIKITGKRISDKEYQLSVLDNGIGIPFEVNFEKSESLGLKIVNLMAMQLSGNLELKRDKGTEFIITFTDLK